MADMKVRVRAHSENATKTVVKARNFQLIIDEPTEMGGTNEGATPVEYVLGAFSGCLNVMAHLIAKEMDISKKGVWLHLVSHGYSLSQLKPNRANRMARKQRMWSQGY